MANHDYVIANGTGQAVRSDLNNALAAIVSNNSSSSEPATKYAYQWWADTTTGQLKLRNSANNAWVTIFELDGTMLMEDGTVSAPGLAFASDLNTGFFRSAADKINFATGGVERLEIGSSEVVFNDGSNDVDFRVESNGNANMLFVDGGNDAVGIGTAAPDSTLEIAAGPPRLKLTRNSTASTGNDFGRIVFENSAGTILSRIDCESTSGNTQSALTFSNGGSERMRVDNSGNVGVGLTSAASKLHVKGGSLTVEHSSPSTGTGQLNINPENNSQVTFSYDDQGHISFGTATTPATQAGFSEKLRIDSSGNVGIGTSSPSSKLHVSNTSGESEIRITANSSNQGILRFGNQVDPTLASIRFNSPDDSLQFYGNNDTERMRIDSTGKVFIKDSTGADDITLVHDGTNGSIANAGGEFLLYAEGSQNMIFHTNGIERMRLTSSGNATFAGAVSKGSGSFKISHPLPAKTETHHLVHSFIEGPQADLIYRGYVDLVDGQAIVNIDTAARMSEGTFEVLCTNVSCFTSNESDWTAVKGSVTGNVLTIVAQDATATSKVSWMVVGERKDQHMIDTEWTDDAGRVITEPEKVVEAVEETEE